MAKGDKERQQRVSDTSYNNSNNLLNNTFERQQKNIYSPAVNNYSTGSTLGLTDYNQTMNSLNQFRNPQTTNIRASDTSSFGNLTDPNTWMGLVGDQNKLRSWLQTAYPQLDPKGLDYYTQHITEKPGANPTEQAGSADYWLKRVPEWFGDHSNDPFYNSVQSSMSGYQNFADTGGFSPQDVQNIRARMIAPIRSIYSGANRDVDRQRRLQHGYSPNYTAAKAKMAREQAYATSDATTNAEAQIAEMLRSGKLAGLSGLSQTGLAGRGQNLQSLGTQTGLYSASPGLAGTFGNQALAASGQDIDIQRLRQALDQQKVANQLGVAGVPSDFQQLLGYGGEIMGLLGQGATAASGTDWSKIFSKTPKAFSPDSSYY
jgi:hypothetical protein